MKYKLLKELFMGNEYFSVVVTNDEVNFTSFPAEIGNPNYDQFLLQVELSDKEVKALPTDEWFEV